MLDAQLLGIEDLGDSYMASVEFSGMIREEPSAGPSPFREVWNMTKPKSGVQRLAGGGRAGAAVARWRGLACAIQGIIGDYGNTVPFFFGYGLFWTRATVFRLAAPAWLVDEVQHRLVLLLNHVLMQEPEAQARLKRQAGRGAVQWRGFTHALAATPAGCSIGARLAPRSPTCC
jgi:hypothetical protein